MSTLQKRIEKLEPFLSSWRIQRAQETRDLSRLSDAELQRLIQDSGITQEQVDCYARLIRLDESGLIAEGFSAEDARAIVERNWTAMTDAGLAQLFGTEILREGAEA